MESVSGEEHIYKSTKSAQEHVEYGFGKREVDRRGLKWNKKEMPSLATQRRVLLW